MSSVRKSFVSKRYSPTTSAISSFSAAGYVYFDSSDGVRKHPTMTPFNGFGG